MSEFSESFHLRVRDGSVDDAVAILRAAGVAGYVAPAARGWVSFVYEPDEPPARARFDAVLRAAGRATLLHWDYAEDHGCTATLYEAGERVGRVRVSFESRRVTFDREAFTSRGLLTPAAAQDVAEWLQYAIPGATLAERLGLPRFQWFAFDYAERERGQGAKTELAYVDREGRTDDDRSPAVLGVGEGEGTPWDALAKRAVSTWIAEAMIELAEDADRAALEEALADFLAGEPPPDAGDLEGLLLDHDAVAEVFASGADLVRAARRP